MLFYVVIYDIPCDKRRRKVFDLLEGYGQWVQYSCFECILSQDKFDELKSRLKKRVNLDEDSVRFYPLSKHTRSQVETWGVGPSVRQETRSVIV